MGGSLPGFSNVPGGALGQAAFRAGVGNVIAQGVGVATGLQKSFSWRGVAASAVSAGVGRAIGEALGDAQLLTNKDALIDPWNTAARNLVSGIAAGAASSLVRGGRVNWGSVVQDAVGATIGEAITTGVASSAGSVQAPVLAGGDTEDQKRSRLYYDFSSTANATSTVNAAIATTDDSGGPLLNNGPVQQLATVTVTAKRLSNQYAAEAERLQRSLDIGRQARALVQGTSTNQESGDLYMRLGGRSNNRENPSPTFQNKIRDWARDSDRARTVKIQNEAWANSKRTDIYNTAEARPDGSAGDAVRLQRYYSGQAEGLGWQTLDVAAIFAGPLNAIRPLWSLGKGALTYLGERAAATSISERLTIAGAEEARLALESSAAARTASGLEARVASRVQVGVLNEYSQTAIRAADDIAFWVPKDKHLLSGGSERAGKFSTDSFDEVRSLVAEGLRSPNAQFFPNSKDFGFQVVFDFGRSIGTRGQTKVRIVVSENGSVANAFPVKTR